MGELFRSEEMSSVQLFVQIDAVHATVDELGQLGVVQFRDVSHFISLSSNLPLFGNREFKFNNLYPIVVE